MLPSSVKEGFWRAATGTREGEEGGEREGGGGRGDEQDRYRQRGIFESDEFSVSAHGFLDRPRRITRRRSGSGGGGDGGGGGADIPHRPRRHSSGSSNTGSGSSRMERFMKDVIFDVEEMLAKGGNTIVDPGGLVHVGAVKEDWVNTCGDGSRGVQRARTSSGGAGDAVNGSSAGTAITRRRGASEYEGVHTGDGSGSSGRDADAVGGVDATAIAAAVPNVTSSSKATQSSVRRVTEQQQQGGNVEGSGGGLLRDDGIAVFDGDDGGDDNNDDDNDDDDVFNPLVRKKTTKRGRIKRNGGDVSAVARSSVDTSDGEEEEDDDDDDNQQQQRRLKQQQFTSLASSSSSFPSGPAAAAVVGGRGRFRRRSSGFGEGNSLAEDFAYALNLTRDRMGKNKADGDDHGERDTSNFNINFDVSVKSSTKKRERDRRWTGDEFCEGGGGGGGRRGVGDDGDGGAIKRVTARATSTDLDGRKDSFIARAARGLTQKLSEIGLIDTSSGIINYTSTSTSTSTPSSTLYSSSNWNPRVSVSGGGGGMAVGAAIAGSRMEDGGGGGIGIGGGETDLWWWRKKTPLTQPLLYGYGAKGGYEGEEEEDDDDDDDGDEDDELLLFSSSYADEDEYDLSRETTAALRPSNYHPEVAGKKEATAARTVLTFVKGMVGTYILYLPHMFAEGGLIFAIIVVAIIGVLSTYNMLLLMTCRKALADGKVTPNNIQFSSSTSTSTNEQGGSGSGSGNGGMVIVMSRRQQAAATATATAVTSFGDVGFAAMGSAGRFLVDVSLFLSQLGYCTTYYIFVAENIGSTIRDAAPAGTADAWTTTKVLVGLQVLAYIPLSWIRKVKYLGLGMFIANIALALGLAIIIAFMLYRLISEGVIELSDDDDVDGGRGEVGLSHNLNGASGTVGHYDISLFQKETSFIFMGAVVSCFEGIGLVIPIQDSMEHAHRESFPRLLCWTMVVLTTFYAGFGVVGYLAYGNQAKEFVTTELPPHNALANTAKITYSLAVMLSYPLQLLPASVVFEKLMWNEQGKKPSVVRKWSKNAVRVVLVGVTALVAIFAHEAFDNFVGVISGLCAVPLALVYPIVFHLQLFGIHRLGCWRYSLDCFFVALGLFAMGASSFISILTWRR